jgi:hypothetical protein
MRCSGKLKLLHLRLECIGLKEEVLVKSHFKKN